MSLRKTCAPSRAIACAIAWPMPSAAPGMTAVFPSSRAISASCCAPALGFVESHCGDDDHAGDDELGLGRQPKPAQAIGQELQDQHTERHATQVADAAGETDPAKHGRGDPLEFEIEPPRVLRQTDAAAAPTGIPKLSPALSCAEPTRPAKMMPATVASNELMIMHRNFTRRTS